MRNRVHHDRGSWSEIVKHLATLLAIGLCIAAPATFAQELGRLFLTPEQRATLDERRRAKLPDKPEAVPVVVTPVTRVDGFVERGGGKSTVWVNGEAVPEGSRTGTARIEPGRPGGTRIIIGAPEEEREAKVRVGESVDTSTGSVQDPLGGGEIRVRK
jgi:hypothetical protein